MRRTTDGETTTTMAMTTKTTTRAKTMMVKARTRAGEDKRTASVINDDKDKGPSRHVSNDQGDSDNEDNNQVRSRSQKQFCSDFLFTVTRTKI